MKSATPSAFADDGALDEAITAMGLDPNGDCNGRVASTRSLPGVIDVLDLLARAPAKPPELVSSILHKGAKLVLGGASKTNKTWSLLDLAISVASGVPWWGFETSQGKVLYLNFEVAVPFVRDRIERVQQAKAAHLPPGAMMMWNLRGHAADLVELAPAIIKQMEEEYSLLVIDPIYKCLNGRDENDAGQVAGLCNVIEHVATRTGAAVAFAAHFSKGSQAGKASIDRISGSGVWSRDPDAILTLTSHEKEGAYVVDATLRNFKPLEAFAVQWDFPLMRRADLDPTRLRLPRKGRTSIYEEKHLLGSLPEAGLSFGAWRDAVIEATGMSESTFKILHRKLQSSKTVVNVGGKWLVSNWDKVPVDRVGAAEPAT